MLLPMWVRRPPNTTASENGWVDERGALKYYVKNLPSLIAELKDELEHFGPGLFDTTSDSDTPVDDVNHSDELTPDVDVEVKDIVVEPESEQEQKQSSEPELEPEPETPQSTSTLTPKPDTDPDTTRTDVSANTNTNTRGKYKTRKKPGPKPKNPTNVDPS